MVGCKLRASPGDKTTTVVVGVERAESIMEHQSTWIGEKKRGVLN